ncbi:MAG: hypothetical protein AAGG48_19655 [Planctomycetota bacterium]
MVYRILVVVALFIVVGTFAMQGTEPFDPGYVLPKDVLLPTPDDTDASFPQPIPGVPLNEQMEHLIPMDLVGEGMHELMRSRPSVLDSFPNEEEFLLTPSAEEPARTQTESPVSDEALIAETAEQLLKAARLLRAADGNNERAVALAKQMQSEAARLLSE